MIKNVIFDLGGVLIDFNPTQYLIDLGYNEEEKNTLMNIIFKNPLWLELDRGTYTRQEGIDLFSKENPKYAKDIERILNKNWFNILKYKPDTGEFLKKLKSEGYKLYVLSNFHTEGFEIIEKKYDFFKLFDGKVVSGYIHMVKPDADIYKYLLDKYSLVPEESVFLDDVEKNIEAGKKLNINGILFTTLSEVKEKFYEMTKK